MEVHTMNKFFINNLYNIFTVSKALTKDGYTCDTSEAFLRFKADVALGENLDNNSDNNIVVTNNTGDALPGFDFKAAKAEWDKLGEDGQKQAIEDYDAFIDAHYREACDAFDNGKEACDALAREAQ